MTSLMLGPLSLPIRPVSSPVTVQSVGGEVLRLKRIRRMSSSEANETVADVDLREKVVTSSGDLAYYTSAQSPTGTPQPAAIALPAQTATGWTQADLEHTTIGLYNSIA